MSILLPQVQGAFSASLVSPWPMMCLLETSLALMDINPPAPAYVQQWW